MEYFERLSIARNYYERLAFQDLLELVKEGTAEEITEDEISIIELTFDMQDEEDETINIVRELYNEDITLIKENYICGGE